MTLCDWCQTNSGRIKKGRHCCDLRELANAPREAQAAYAKGLTDDQRNELRPRLVAEIARLKQLRLESRHQGGAQTGN